MITKLKSTSIKKYRLELLEQQNGMCGICKLPCSEEQAVLDHNHTFGYVRAVLHRGCNAIEGKIINAMRRYGIKDVSGYLNGLLEYHTHHTENRTGLIHPTHKTIDEKKALIKKRAKKKRVLQRNKKLISGSEEE